MVEQDNRAWQIKYYQQLHINIIYKIRFKNQDRNIIRWD